MYIIIIHIIQYMYIHTVTYNNNNNNNYIVYQNISSIYIYILILLQLVTIHWVEQMFFFYQNSPFMKSLQFSFI